MLAIRDSFHVRGICQQLRETNLAVVPLDVQLSRTKSAIFVGVRQEVDGINGWPQNLRKMQVSGGASGERGAWTGESDFIDVSG